MIDETRLVKQKEKCSACGACMNICPRNAISMREDPYGFVFPEINEEKCVQCGACVKVCRYSDPNLSTPIKGFAAFDSCEEELRKSASGGVSAALARSIVQNGGVVFGAAMSYDGDNMRVYHRKVDTVEDLVCLQGSKYTQSEIGYTYQETKDVLKTGKKVLFTGTPCQISGLKSYLGKEYDNLYTADLVCHGVANQKVFRDFIKHKEKQLGGTIVQFDFRTKEKGWGIYTGITYVRNGHEKRIYQHSGEQSYCNYFMKGKFDRINCYSCPYAKGMRIGDVTICDFWGVQKSCPELMKINGGEYDDFKGISGILVNSSKGESLLAEFGKLLHLSEVDPQKIIMHNPQLRHASEMKNRDDALLDRYSIEGYEAIEKDYQQKEGTISKRFRRTKVRIKKQVKAHIPIGIKKTIKNMIR